MLVSVVVCAHSLDQRRDLREAVASLLEQTQTDLEVIVVVDGDLDLYREVMADYGGNDAIRAVLLEENAGISAARNAGVAEARGEVVAFIDDDAIADKDWVQTLVGTYEQYDAIAVGGKILPMWLGGQPDYFPEELLWLVGATHDGFAGDAIMEVRNTFGPNMSFRRDVFEKVGGFNENLGFSRKGASYVQAEEPEFALRMTSALGKRVVYNPGAVVHHKIRKSKVRVKILLRRAFYQGYSKALIGMQGPSGGTIATERSYLRTLLLTSVPARLRRVYRLPELKKLLLLLGAVVSVGLGFLYGHLVGRLGGWHRR